LITTSTIGRLQHSGDAALRVPGVRLIDGIFGEDQHIRADIGRGDRRTQASHSPADHQYIRELLWQARRFEWNQISTLTDGF
jgi:hypothetical protein